MRGLHVTVELWHGHEERYEHFKSDYLSISSNVGVGQSTEHLFSLFSSVGKTYTRSRKWHGILAELPCHSTDGTTLFPIFRPILSTHR